MDNYFIYEGIKYIIKYNDNKRIIFKEINGNIIELTKEEQSKIDEIFTIDNGYVYYSERIDSIIQMNDNIVEKDYLINYFNWIENIIPESYRDNFYRNLKTLKIDLNFDYINDKNIEDLSNEEYTKSGNYNTVRNDITISKKSIFDLINISKNNSNPEDFFWREYSSDVLHELLHMASSKYDSDTGIALCGFDKYPSENLKEQNRGLTEGMTDCLAMTGVPGTIEVASKYYMEVCFIVQLANIVGRDVLLKSYFGNLGINEIEKELHKFDSSTFKSFQLFKLIEDSYMLNVINVEKNNIVGNVQKSLIDYLEKKVNVLESNGLYDEIDNTLKMYEMGLITPEKLDMMNKNSGNYAGVKESIDKFNELKNKYIKENNVSILK